MRPWLHVQQARLTGKSKDDCGTNVDTLFWPTTVNCMFSIGETLMTVTLYLQYQTC